MHLLRFTILILLGLSASPCGLRAAELMVFAAASLSESLQEIATDYEKQTRDHLVFNFGGSGLLARQIEQGGPADLFFSADEARMDALEKGNWLLPGTRKSRLSNTLVIVVATDHGASVATPTDLTSTSVRRLALAETRSVPAGIYAREFLERQHLWTAVESRVVPTENVRAALAAVESGNADAGIVYKTDAAITKRVRVVYEIPAKDLSPISYPVAVLRASRQPEAAQRFLAYLLSPKTAEVFRRRGFLIAP